MRKFLHSSIKLSFSSFFIPIRFCFCFCLLRINFSPAKPAEEASKTMRVKNKAGKIGARERPGGMERKKRRKISDKPWKKSEKNIYTFHELHNVRWVQDQGCPRSAVSSTSAQHVCLLARLTWFCGRGKCDIWQHIASGRRKLIIGEDLKDVFKRIMDKYKDFFSFFLGFFSLLVFKTSQSDVCLIREKSVFARSVDAIVRQRSVSRLSSLR